jgi:hypothetical protein
MLHLKAAAAWLAAIHPSLPWVLLTVALWLVQYGTRKTKAGAIVWEWAANLPFSTDITPRLHVLRKLWQSLPSTLAGALIGAVGIGGDYAGAALGALAGFGAAVKHEVWKGIKAVPYVGATAPLPVKAKPPRKLGDDDDTPPSAGAGGSLRGLPGAAAVMLAIGLALGGATSCGLFGGTGPDAPAAPAVDRDAALRLAFNSSALALDFIDQTEAAYLDALPTPTAEQLAGAQQRVLRLKRARAVLQVARDWLDGKLPEDEGRKALADATELLRIAGEELESQGVKLPPAVRDGLAAAAALLGGAS